MTPVEFYVFVCETDEGMPHLVCENTGGLPLRDSYVVESGEVNARIRPSIVCISNNQHHQIGCGSVGSCTRKPKIVPAKVVRRVPLLAASSTASEGPLVDTSTPGPRDEN